jgi:PEP-CTERM motif
MVRNVMSGFFTGHPCILYTSTLNHLIYSDFSPWPAVCFAEQYAIDTFGTQGATMNATKRFLLSIFLAVTAVSAQADVISCPGTAATTDREFTLTTAIAATCLAFGTGNINGNGDAINSLGYTLLDKSDDSISGLTPFNWLSITGSGTTGGGFSFTAPPGYTSFVIAFKSGEGQLDPDWAAFLLPAGILSGSWSISGQQSLSHANLYGLRGSSFQVPEPSTLVLFGIAFAGLALARHRTGRASSSTT